MNRRDILRATLGLAAGAALPPALVEAAANNQVANDNTRFLLLRKPVNFLVEKQVNMGIYNRRTTSIYTRLIRGVLENGQFRPIEGVRGVGVLAPREPVADFDFAHDHDHRVSFITFPAVDRWGLLREIDQDVAAAIGVPHATIAVTNNETKGGFLMTQDELVVLVSILGSKIDVKPSR